MGNINFQCPVCDEPLIISARRSGDEVQCPNCHAEVRVPEERHSTRPRINTGGETEDPAPVHRLCPACEELVPDRAAFCPFCGQSLGSQGEAESKRLNIPALASLGTALFAWPVVGICFFWILGRLIQSLLVGAALGLAAVGLGAWAAIRCFRRRSDRSTLTLSFTGIILGAFGATMFGFYATVARQASDILPGSSPLIKQVLGTAEQSSVVMKCRECGHTFEASPASVLFGGTGNVLQGLYGNKDINEVLDEYDEQGMQGYECPRCGEREASPARRCPECGTAFLPDASGATDGMTLETECPNCGARLPLLPTGPLPGMSGISP